MRLDPRVQPTTDDARHAGYVLWGLVVPSYVVATRSGFESLFYEAASTHNPGC